MISSQLVAFFLLVLFPNDVVCQEEPASSTDAVTVNISEVNPDDWLRECFATFVSHCCVNIDQGDFHIFYSNFDLIDQPSGNCQDHLSCAFEKCDDAGFEQVALLGPDVLKNITYDVVKDTLGPLNLPDSIAHVVTAAHVVQAVNYAKTNNKTISIKSTGHSYTGANTMANSLQLNLRNLRKYSEDAIVECASVQNETDQNYKPCLLAQDRGKKALIKVGGGEVWSDVYVAVIKASKKIEEQGGLGYDVVGGGAGSVGAAGGWLQGGGWSHGVERLYGLGIDQVLEFEMVLADGRHVRFGPSDWETVQGYLYPKTLAVAGKCNTNVHEGEDNWIWEGCSEPVPPFADLWYAVRGGGGGTFGVVTALKYQLHEKRPLTFVTGNTNALNSIYLKSLGTVDEEARFFIDFLLDFLYNPSALGITQETSNLCGSPSLLFNIFWYSTIIFCYDDGFEQMNAAWQQKVDDSDYWLLAGDLKNLLAASPNASSFAEFILASNKDEFRPEGRVPDNPLPNFVPDKGFAKWCSAQLPENWLGDYEQRELAVDVLMSVGGEHVTGGLVSVAGDQMNALTPAARTSGLSSVDLASLPVETQNRLLALFYNYTNKVTNDTGFPGITEINHVCPDSYGPLKSNTTEICPPDYTVEQKEAECMSIQESIWGTEILARLEEIKYAVDPDNMFDCYGCVKGRAPLEVSASTPLPASSAPILAPTVTPGPTSISTTSAPPSSTSVTSTSSPISTPPTTTLPTDPSLSRGSARSFMMWEFNLGLVIVFIVLSLCMV